MKWDTLRFWLSAIQTGSRSSNASALLQFYTGFVQLQSHGGNVGWVLAFGWQFVQGAVDCQTKKGRKSGFLISMATVQMLRNPSIFKGVVILSCIVTLYPRWVLGSV